MRRAIELLAIGGIAVGKVQQARRRRRVGLDRNPDPGQIGRCQQDIGRIRVAMNRDRRRGATDTNAVGGRRKPCAAGVRLRRNGQSCTPFPGHQPRPDDGATQIKSHSGRLRAE